jgi:hypothetical protein
VIASGALTYYDQQNDMFDENRDSKGEIALANILVVESTAAPQLRSDMVFDVHARVIEGGDKDGMRVFTFDARTPDAAETWMREICRATEVLELKRGPRGWASAVSPEMVREKNAKALKLKSGIFAGHSPMVLNREESGGSGSAFEEDTEGSTTTGEWGMGMGVSRGGV